MKRTLLFGLCLSLLLAVAFGQLNFVSTQFHPATEREYFEGSLLPDFVKLTNVKVQFLPLTYEEASVRLRAEQAANRVTIGLFAELQGGMELMASGGLLKDISGVTFSDRTFISTFEKYAHGYGIKQFVPWLQATFVMVINKKAFDYLPKGLTKEDVLKGTSKWTYQALLEWAKNIYDKTKMPMVGFPENPQGLFHRFLHGYLYPSFTGGQFVKFDSLDAVDMWAYLKELFKYVSPGSSTWSFMSEPLMRNEAWIVWDHTARIPAAVRADPEQYIPAPVPAGPKGRGFITVLVGLALPKNAPNEAEAVKLIDYLTSATTQFDILEKTGFFPVIEEAIGVIPAGPNKVLAEAVVAQAGAPDAMVSFIPGLGPKGGEFTAYYREAFRRIVYENEDIKKVLQDIAPKVYQTVKESGATLPQPDASLFH